MWRTANRTVCLSNVRQLGAAILMYCNDNDGWFPTCAAPTNNLSLVPYPDDWLHWQSNRDVTNSALAPYLGRDEQLKNLLRCPADTFDGRKRYPGTPAAEGPYPYSYSLNAGVGENIKGGEPHGYRTKINRWRSPSRKIMVTEGSGDIPGSFYAASWYYAAPLTLRHGIGRFHKNIPGNSVLRFGAKLGTNVSAVFFDGHAKSIDQDFAYDYIHGAPQAQ